MANVTRLPFADEQFDSVLVTAALGLLPPPPQGAAQAISRFHGYFTQWQFVAFWFCF
jgi:hypothetical protein